MERAIVIGCPGGGKSTFARALAEKTGLPLHHLDMMYWNADKTIVERELFLSRLASAMETPRWIIDGNFFSTMEERIAACDTVFFLDYPREVCLAGVEGRMGKPRADMPWVETEWDVEFKQYIEDFEVLRRPKILALLEKHTEKQIYIFRTREEAGEFIEVMK
jgi:adenylate kinase family enzyme